MNKNSDNSLIDNDIWLTDARVVVSPHFNERPVETDISLLVIHNISLPPKVFGNEFIENFFCGRLNPDHDPYFESICHLKVSAHFLIKRNGELVQFVPLNKRAWHAGESLFEGRTNCNDFSIGIELEGADDIAYTNAQYSQLIRVTDEIISLYPKITKERITGHCNIAPDRKSDPGESFDWQRYKQSLKINKNKP